jgi:hypothetical protein
MRKLLALSGLAVAFSVMALAEDYTGHLLDATCYAQSKMAKNCDAKGSTSQFALDVSGKVYRLDEAGNAKAADAMKSRADRSADPAKPTIGPVNAKVTATADGDTLKIDSIQVQ